MVKRTFIFVVIKGVVKVGGPVTWERDIFGQNTFCNISLYIESAKKKKTNARIFNFQFLAFIKLPTVQASCCKTVVQFNTVLYRQAAANQ